jgi:hypothetical protein
VSVLLMKFTQCPSCCQRAASTLSQLLWAEQIQCRNCDTTLVHSVRTLVAILVIHLILYLLVVQFLAGSGLVIVILVTMIFSLSIIFGCALLLPLVIVEEEDARKGTSKIQIWYHSPIPYLAIFTAMAWMWHIYGRGT